jgi:hypothetical protein
MIFEVGVYVVGCDVEVVSVRRGECGKVVHRLRCGSG